jgi:hypothetical protein
LSSVTKNFLELNFDELVKRRSYHVLGFKI